jgi:hypothetical protein
MFPVKHVWNQNLADEPWSFREAAVRWHMGKGKDTINKDVLFQSYCQFIGDKLSAL